jgi:hypothetical protein
MNDIPQVSLFDTINVIQLARETALAKGNEAQAKRLVPVVNGLQQLVTQSQTVTSKPSPDSGIVGREDFSNILNAVQSTSSSNFSLPSQNVVERNQMIQSMAAADMTDLEIAKQMGMSREEVNLIVSVSERSNSGKEVT